METIEYYHENSDVVSYRKEIYDDGYWSEKTYDEKGNLLTFKNSDGYSFELTYDEKGNQLTFKDSDNIWGIYTAP